MALILASAVAKTVVDVKRADALGAHDPDGEIEQASGVAPTGEQDHDRTSGRQQPIASNPVGDACFAHRLNCSTRTAAVTGAARG
ncbi:MAG TPA: hypothetical protein VGT98_14800, partial [Candidatus Elarobacter sp.]|nr:hypothetical protein [Candidatus Elarobacter sp.]